MKFIPVIVLICLGIISFYFGVGGTLESENYNEVSKDHDFSDTVSVKIHKIVYKNYAEMLLEKEDQESLDIFPWITKIPTFVGKILTSCFFGMLGGIISILKDIVLKKTSLSETHYFSIPILGFLTGLAILGLNYIVPNVLVSGNTNIRPITLLFLCLFAGIYVEEFYHFLSQVISKKVFKNHV